MAYYGNNTAIEQGAAGIGEYFRPMRGMGEYFAANGLGQPPDGPLKAYADGVVGGRPAESTPGPLLAYRDGIFSSLGADPATTPRASMAMVVAGVAGLALGALAGRTVGKKKMGPTVAGAAVGAALGIVALRVVKPPVA